MAQGPTRRPGERPRIQVEGPEGTRPFMRGILIHSLMAQGVSFEDAYRTANRVRDRLRGTEVVGAEELEKLVQEMCASGGVQPEPIPAFTPGISVGGAGDETPFSKGILSQSIVAAALDPNAAFDVALRIEERLLRDRVERIERRELRRIAWETLRATAGDRVAQRYLVWRHYQQSDKPVMILIGGASGVGKTALALEVAHRLGIGRVLSTDAIRQVMRTMLSEELMPAIHRSSYEAHGGEGFEPSPGADPVLEAFVTQASVVSVGARAMLDRAVAENASLVMDGVSLVPGRLGLPAYADRAHVIFLMAAAFDEAALRKRFTRRSRGAKDRAHQRYLDHMDAILRIQEHLLDLADLHGVPIVENVDFDRSVLSIIKHVTETLGQDESFDAASLL